MDYLSNNSMYMLEKSMGFLWTKQAAIADNIANAETPNYKTKFVRFEEDLRSRLESAVSGGNFSRRAVRGALDGASVEVYEAPESTRMDDNGVNTTEQMTELVRNAYQLQYVMQAISSDLAVLQSVARG